MLTAAQSQPDNFDEILQGKALLGKYLIENWIILNHKIIVKSNIKFQKTEL